MKKAVSWISSPLGLNLLLAFRNNTQCAHKYLHINDLLRNNLKCKVETKIFTKSNIKANNSNVANIEVNDQPLAAFTEWIENNTQINVDLSKYQECNGQIVGNIIKFKDTWPVTDNNTLKMIIYNSFNYTQDVKYEARILEFPLRNNEFKLAILVPNESDVLDGLFNTLTCRGYEEAITSIEPLFTAQTYMKSPHINIQCGCFKQICNEANILQSGYVNVNENGVYIDVVSCMNISSPESVLSINSNICEHVFYFGLIYENMPIFTGMFSQS